MALGALGTILNTEIALFSREKTDIEGLTGIVDIYTDERHVQTVTKTKYQVEDGKSITDNAVVNDKILTLKGLVSDLNPLLGGLVTIPGPGRGKEAWSRIGELKDKAEPLSVVTTLEMYESMLITSLDSTVNKDTGQALAFTVVLEELQFAESQSTTLPASQLDEQIETKGSVEQGGSKQSQDSEASVLHEISEGLKDKGTEITDYIKGLF